MNKSGLVLSVSLVAAAGPVAAACEDATRLDSGTAIYNHLRGQTVCGTGEVNTNDRWQEWHQDGGASTGGGGGTLTEYAKGPSDPVDPSKDVGTWSASGVSGNGIVTYAYNGGGSYSFNVHVNSSGETEFCDGSTPVATAFRLSGEQSCGF